MALEDVSAHRGGTDPIEGLIRIETSPRELPTPIIMEMIRRGSVDSGVTAATWTARAAPARRRLCSSSSRGPCPPSSEAPQSQTHRCRSQHGNHHRRNLAPRTNLLTCVRSPDRVTSATWPNLRKYLPKSQELCRNAGLTLLALSIVRNGSTQRLDGLENW
jgi:hypothetical protein